MRQGAPTSLNLLQHQINPFPMPHIFSLEAKFFPNPILFQRGHLPFCSACRKLSVSQNQYCRDPGLGPAFSINFFFLHEQTEHHRGRGDGREIQVLVILCINYCIHKLRHARGTIQYKTAHSTTSSANGNNRQPAVIRILEHRFICINANYLCEQPPPTNRGLSPEMTNGRHTSVPSVDRSTDQEILTSERTLQFITAFTTVRHRLLSCYQQVQSTSSRTYFLRSILVLNCSFCLLLSTFSIQFTFT